MTGQEMQQIRKEKGITQDQLSKFFDISKVQISKMENNKSKVESRTALLMHLIKHNQLVVI